MSRAIRMFTVSTAGVMLAAAFANAVEDTRGLAATVSRYTELIPMAEPAGAAPTVVRVEIKDLFFVRSEKPVSVSEGVFFIAQLRSGLLDTEIGGKRERRVAGDVWKVAADESMNIMFPPHRQAAQIRIVTMAQSTGKQPK